MKLLGITLLVLLVVSGTHGFGSSLRCATRSSKSSGGADSPTLEIAKLRRGASVPPPNFKVAFLGDQGVGENSKAVMTRLKEKKVELILHAGDNDYENDPAAWDAQITEVLGEDFPYFSSIGNHDSLLWGVPGGYQARIENRLKRINATSYCTGEAGVKMACNYQGFLFVTSGVGCRQLDHPLFFDEVFTGSQNIWRAVSWHKNQRLYQVGGKINEVGYEVYDTARKHGAIIATGHEHSYSRTHLMSDFSEQVIASTDPTIALSQGKSFAFVSGLAGRSIRDYQYGLKDKPWWAATAASQDAVSYGALVCTFNVNGEESLAECEFEDLKGVIWDKFQIRTNVTANAKLAKGIPCSGRFDDISIDFSEGDISEKLGSSVLATSQKIIQLGGDSLSAFFFPQNGLKKGAKIAEVHLQFLGAKASQDERQISIKGLKAFPLNGELISSFETTKTEIAWIEEDEDWEVGTVWVSPDLSPLIQEIISQENWKEGDPISLVISGPGERFVYSFDQDDCLAPSLIIEYHKQC